MSVFKNADFMHLCIYKLDHPCALGHWLLGHLGCPWVKGGGGGGGGGSGFIKKKLAAMASKVVSQILLN